MEMPELAQGLKKGLFDADVAKFDMLFFYACLMGNYEVAHTFQPYARHMIASEEIAIGASFRLERLQIAYDDPSVDSETLSIAIMEDYVPMWASAYPKVTVSLTNLEAIPDFEAALTALLQDLKTGMKDTVGDIMIARSKAAKFASLPMDWMSMHLVDLGGILLGLAQLRPDLSDELDATLAAYDAMVLANYAGPEHPGATGLSVFFPPSLEYYNRVNDWKGTTPGEEYEAIKPPEAWHDFLMAVLKAVTIKDAGPTFACSEVDDPNPLCQNSTWIVEGADTIEFSYPLDKANLDDTFKAWFMFGEYPLGASTYSVDFYTQFPAEIDPKTGIVTGIFDYRRLVLSQGDKKSDAYWTLDTAGGKTTVTVPIAYLDPKADMLQPGEWRALVDPQDWSVIAAELLLRDSDGQFDELVPAANSKVYTAVHSMDMEWYLYNWEPLYTAFDPTLPFEVSFVDIEPCRTYMYALYVEDAVGRNDMIAGSRCKPFGEPSFHVTVDVESEGKWDSNSLPDFRTTLTIAGEPFQWDVVQDSATARFETDIPKVRNIDFQLRVVEVDDDMEQLVVDKNATKYFGQADSMCKRVKSWQQEQTYTDYTYKVTLTVSKCE